MLRVRQKIEAIVGQLSIPLKFYYTSDREQNFAINAHDVLEGKAVVRLRQIESGQFIQNSRLGSFKESYPESGIQFLTLSEHSYDSVQNDRLIDEMKAHAKEFLLRLDDSALFEPLSTVQFFHVYNATDDVLTGVEILCTLIEKNSQEVCI